MLTPIADLGDFDVPEDIYLTAASFEHDRAVAATEYLTDHLTAHICVVLLFSGSSVGAEGDRKKASSRAQLTQLGRRMSFAASPRVLRVGRYELGRLMSELWWEVENNHLGNGLRVTVDISCITRIHLIYLVKSLIDSGRVGRLRLVYSEPMKYNNSKGGKHGHLGKAAFSTVPIPLIAKRRRSLVQVRRIAFVLLGHEGQRTLCAWRRVDPSQTIAIFPRSLDAGRMRSCQVQNQHLLEYVSADGSLLSCENLDLDQARVRTESALLELIGRDDVRLYLLPFGPKPLVVGALLGMLQTRDIDCDLMYAIPSSYNPDYSAGVNSISFYDVHPSEYLVGRHGMHANGPSQLIQST